MPKKYAYAQIADILENWSYYTERVNRGLLSVAGSQWQKEIIKCSAKLPRDFVQDPQITPSQKEFLNKYSAVELTRRIAAKFKKSSIK